MKNKYLIIFALFFLAFFSSYIFNKVIVTDNLIYSSLSEQLVQEQVEKLIEGQKKWAWLGYTIIPLIVLLRSSLVALCLSVGNFFYNMDEIEIPKFKDFFRIALLGEFVLVLVGYFKFGYFYFIKTDFTLEDLQQYYPLSYINFLELENLELWLIYPLQTINLFEVTYFFVLVYGLHKLLKNKYWKSFEMVAVSYGTGLVIWLGLVMFLTLNMT
ncbi:MAG: hypothetical protein L3J20_11465 [Flavobacteriaceae bacterium]|nr:hypothetical protein [Flavobacteriaceae bacterium]